MGGSFGRGGSVYEIKRPRPQSDKRPVPDQEEENAAQDTTKEDLILAGSGASVQGQSLRGNGATVQGQGLFKDIFQGTTKVIKAVGDATANVVGAAVPDTVNLTPTINNQASVIGLKSNPNLRQGAANQKGNLEAASEAINGATVEGQGFFQELFRDSNAASNIRNAASNIRNKVQNIRDRLGSNIRVPNIVIGLKQSPEDPEENTALDTTKEDLILAGSGASVQGQSLRGNGATVEGQGLKDILRGVTRGTTKIIKAAGDATANIVGAAAPDTANITPTMNNQVSVFGAVGAVG